MLSKLNIPNLCIERKVIRLKNLTTKRRFSVVTLLVALMMFAAGLFASAPAQATSEPVAPFTQSAVVVFEGGPGAATVTLTTHGVSGPGRIGHFHIIKNGDLSGASIPVPAGAGTFRHLTGLVPGDVVEVRVYSDGSGTGELLAREVYPVPEPQQAASIAINPVTGIATVTLTGNGSYHVLLTGDLTRPADVVTGGSLVLHFGPVAMSTPIQVNVYGDGSGSGQRLTDAVLNPPVPPVLEDNTTTKQVTFCSRVNPRAEAFIRTTLTVAEFLSGDHAADIVRPFDYIKQGVSVSHPGNLWDAAGEAVFNRNCSVIPSPSPSETTTASPSPSPTETTTPSSSPSSTTTALPSAPAGGGTDTRTDRPSSPSTTNQSVESDTSQTQTSSSKVSRNPAALVDTAVKDGGVSGFALAPLLFGAAALLVLIAGLLWRGEGRRH